MAESKQRVEQAKDIVENIVRYHNKNLTKQQYDDLQEVAGLLKQATDKKSYKDRKAELEQEAIEYQRDVSENNYSLDYLNDMCQYFLKYGKRYGLLKEFRENGII